MTPIGLVYYDGAMTTANRFPSIHVDHTKVGEDGTEYYGITGAYAAHDGTDRWTRLEDCGEFILNPGSYVLATAVADYLEQQAAYAYAGVLAEQLKLWAQAIRTGGV